ncbi:MAG: hypothetical protein ABIR80_20595, partial [Opitutaceae bacterium]
MSDRDLSHTALELPPAERLELARRLVDSVVAMKAKVLKTERHYKAALAYVERLMDQPSPDEAELELWSLLVENYEETHFPIATPDPIEAIRFRLDQAGLQSADLLPYLQSKSKISEIMNRKRPLSLSMIRALHDG